jgi:hypothetical protein
MTGPVTITTLEVSKGDWGQTRLAEEEFDGQLQDNEVLLRADRFALTANNISYAGAGDLLGYWGFFPAEAGWGRIPVMGYGDVVASAHPSIEVGERVWGFFPMSTHLRVLAGEVSTGQFVDVSPHRADYAPAYSQFQRAIANPQYDPAREDQDSLVRGLFLTSWLCEDFIDDNGGYGASQWLITSGSSKTSIALGYAVRQRGKLQSVALTSPGNREFCESLGCYDRVVCYDEVGVLDAGVPSVIADMAGNAALLRSLHDHFADNVRYSCRIGATHHDQSGDTGEMPGAAPEFFFAPAQIQKRSAEWGAAKFNERMGVDYLRFREFCDAWLEVVRGYGPAAVEAAYREVLAGSASPRQGLILSMWES